jgi:hypothetical protein
VTRRPPFLCLFLAALCLLPASAADPGAAPDAHPGFDGIWNSATVTPLERPLQLKEKAFFTPEEAAEWERQVAERNQEPPPEAVQKSAGTGTYNTFYREFGTRTVKTLRTSIVTDPPDGRIPALTPEAAAVKRRRVEAMKDAASAQDLGLQDQCLAFLTAGPPMLPYSYNSNYRIMQTKDAFVVHAEMIHDTRIIHLDGRPHLPPEIRLWLGDSIGHWEGDTLVVDTVAIREDALFDTFSPHSDQFTVRERIRFTSPGVLENRITSTDPKALVEPFTSVRTYRKALPPNDELREFSCAEGLASAK